MSSALAATQAVRAKSPEAFRTISEVSMALDVPQHVLRFWETRFAQVRPIKRAGGRRFYRPEDVALLRGIRSLLYSDGYTIKGVQKVLRDKGWRFVAEIGRNVSGAVAWNEIGDVAADDGARDDMMADDVTGEDRADACAAAADVTNDPSNDLNDDDDIAFVDVEPRSPRATLPVPPLPPAARAAGPNAAMAALLRAHADAAEKVAMEEHKRVKLELLLAELLVLRDRLRSVRVRL